MWWEWVRPFWHTVAYSQHQLPDYTYCLLRNSHPPQVLTVGASICSAAYKMYSVRLTPCHGQSSVYVVIVFCSPWSIVPIWEVTQNVAECCALYNPNVTKRSQRNLSSGVLGVEYWIISSCKRRTPLATAYTRHGTWNITANEVEGKNTAENKGMIAVHFSCYGYYCSANQTANRSTPQFDSLTQICTLRCIASCRKRQKNYGTDPWLLEKKMSYPWKSSWVVSVRYQCWWWDGLELRRLGALRFILYINLGGSYLLGVVYMSQHAV